MLDRGGYEKSRAQKRRGGLEVRKVQIKNQCKVRRNGNIAQKKGREQGKEVGMKEIMNKRQNE